MRTSDMEPINEGFLTEGETSNDSFKAKEVSRMNRSERRSRIRFYKSEFKKHKAKKPKVNIHLVGDAAYGQQMKIQAWATRYGILLKKLSELGVEKIKG